MSIDLTPHAMRNLLQGLFWSRLTVKLIPGHLGHHRETPNRKEVRDATRDERTRTIPAGTGPVAHDPALRAALEERVPDLPVLRDLALPGLCVAPRYREAGVERLKDRPRGPRVSPYRISPEIEALTLHLHKERSYGAARLCAFLKRYHQVFVSAPNTPLLSPQPALPRIRRTRVRTGWRLSLPSRLGRTSGPDLRLLRAEGSAMPPPLSASSLKSCATSPTDLPAG